MKNISAKLSLFIWNKIMTNQEHSVTRLSHERIMNIIFFVTFLLFISILPMAFINEKSARIAFYLCSYAATTGLLLNLKKTKPSFSSIKYIGPFLALSLLFFFWSVISEWYENADQQSDFLYIAAKRWFLSSLILLFILSFIGKNTGRSRKFLFRLTCASLFVTFLLSSCYGIWQCINGVARITFGGNPATLSAYAYSALTLVIITFLCKVNSPACKLISIIPVWLISILVILFTETRAAILIHTIMSLLIIISTILQDKSLKIKGTFTVSLVILLSFFLLLNKSSLEVRTETTKEEIYKYINGDDHTSLGSRFTLWKMGVISFLDSPFGQTQSHRNTIIKNNLNKNNPHSYALEYIDVHLHNEFIQYASVFGIFGIVVLLYFYTGIIFIAASEENFNRPIIVMTISTFFYGISDVLLISAEYVIIFSTLFLLTIIINKWMHNNLPRE